MNRLRILVLAPGCNPESITIALEGYCQAEALARLHDVVLATRPDSEAPVRRAQGPFRSVEVVPMPWLDRFQNWALRRIFKFNFRSQLLTAFVVPISLAFEWRVWRQFRRRLAAGEFDVVLRLLPLSTVCPSPFAFFLRKGPIPYVLGPLNGGLPWPPGFSQAQRQKQWVSPLRGLYRFLPFARSLRHAKAIIAGSSHTFSELAAHRDKLFYVPTNGLSEWAFGEGHREDAGSDELRLIFVGALVPYKGCDMALKAAASLIRKQLASFTIVGDGPDREWLQQLAADLGIAAGVKFLGEVAHSEVLERLRSADVFVYPSVHEFGGAVVVEALAAGAVPVVADFGGPGDNVHPGVGFAVPLTNETDVIAQIEKLLTRLSEDRSLVRELRERGMNYAREAFSWGAKARKITGILEWVAGRGPKPQLPSPKPLARLGRLPAVPGVAAGQASACD